MRVASSPMLSLDAITDVAVVAYLGVNRYLLSLDQSALPSPSHELNSWLTAAVSVLAFVWMVSRLWEQIVSRGKENAKGIAEEKTEREKIKETVAEYKLDLAERRASVDLRIEKLNWALGELLKRMDVYDSRERKNLRKLEHLDTRIRPWLKEFEPEGTRSISSAFTEIEGEEATGEGNGA